MGFERLESLRQMRIARKHLSRNIRSAISYSMICSFFTARSKISDKHCPCASARRIAGTPCRYLKQVFNQIRRDVNGVAHRDWRVYGSATIPRSLLPELVSDESAIRQSSPFGIVKYSSNSRRAGRPEANRLLRGQTSARSGNERIRDWRCFTPKLVVVEEITVQTFDELRAANAEAQRTFFRRTFAVGKTHWGEAASRTCNDQTGGGTILRPRTRFRFSTMPRSAKIFAHELAMVSSSGASLHFNISALRTSGEPSSAVLAPSSSRFSTTSI